MKLVKEGTKLTLETAIIFNKTYDDIFIHKNGKIYFDREKK